MEDQIVAVGCVLGAVFAGHLGVTTMSGPGVVLKSETISLGVSLELTVSSSTSNAVGPSTGLPTKTEAADPLSPCTGASARNRSRSWP